MSATTQAVNQQSLAPKQSLRLHLAAGVLLVMSAGLFGADKIVRNNEATQQAHEVQAQLQQRQAAAASGLPSQPSGHSARVELTQHSDALWLSALACGLASIATYVMALVSKAKHKW